MKIQQPDSAPAVAVMNVCAECGDTYQELTDKHRGHCEDCYPELRKPHEEQRQRQQTTTELGYGWRWRKLSERARRYQDWCSDCGSPDDLTADHTPEAWQAYQSGRPISLDLIDVVCRRCNTDRGPARGPEATDFHRRPHDEALDAELQRDWEE